MGIRQQRIRGFSKVSVWRDGGNNETSNVCRKEGAYVETHRREIGSWDEEASWGDCMGTFT